MILVGRWALWLAAGAALWAALALSQGLTRGSAGRLRLGRLGLSLSFAATTVACGALVALLLRHDFSSRYVYENVSTHQATLYTVSALWAGQEGSLLLWLWFVCLAGVAVSWRERVSPYGPVAALVLVLIACYLALLLILHAHPFASMDPVPTEGLGLNPLLENIWMAVHPPLIFAAYAAYAVPFGLALGVATQRQMDGAWRTALRRWALLAWLLLSAGILLGARWAYVELGWGGYWGWDPVENASLLPWLTGTALLHTLTAPPRRAGLRILSLWLAAISLALCFLATFITRSGVVRSVHAFAASPVGYAYAAAVVVWPLALALALGLRRTPPSETSSEPHWLSREAGLVISLILLGNMALATLLGTLAPTIMEALRGRAVAVSQSFYEGTVGWLGLALLFVLGVCPSLTWGHTRASLLARRMILPAAFGLAVGIALSAMGLWSGFAVPSLAILAYAFAATLRDLVVDLARSHGPGAEEPPRRIHGRLGRTRRRLGADLVHLALLLMALGIVGSNAYGLSGRIALRPGESAPVGGYTLSYTETVREALPRSERLAAQLTLARSGRVLAELAPERNYYAQMEQWVSEVAVYPGLGQDLYIILEGITDEGIVGLGVLIIPLVSWLWIGGALLLLGGAIAWWPARQRPEDAPSL